jgi:cell division protein FtsB
MNSEIELKQLKKEIEELKQQVATLKGEDKTQILNDPV